MILSLDDVLVYTECPRKYYLRSIGIPSQLSAKADFSIKIHKVIYSFYRNMFDGNLPGAEQLKNEWGTLWSKNLSLQDIMFRKRDEHSDLEMKGLSMLISFHRHAKFNPCVPITVEQNYKVDIGKHQLTGTIELVREVKVDNTDIIEIVDFKMGEYMPDKFYTDHDIYLTAQSYAFRKLFEAVENRIVYYFLKNGKVYYTSRDEFSTFEYTINSIADSIENRVFYPKYSYACKSCPYQHECGRCDK